MTRTQRRICPIATIPCLGAATLQLDTIAFMTSASHPSPRLRLPFRLCDCRTISTPHPTASDCFRFPFATLWFPPPACCPPWPSALYGRWPRPRPRHPAGGHPGDHGNRVGAMQGAMHGAMQGARVTWWGLCLVWKPPSQWLPCLTVWYTTTHHSGVACLLGPRAQRWTEWCLRPRKAADRVTWMSMIAARPLSAAMSCRWASSASSLARATWA